MRSLVLFAIFSINFVYAQSSLDWERLDVFYDVSECDTKFDVPAIRSLMHPLKAFEYDETNFLLTEYTNNESDIEFIVLIQLENDGAVDSVWVEWMEGVIDVDPVWAKKVELNIASKLKYWPECKIPFALPAGKWVVVLPYSFYVIDDIPRRRRTASSELIDQANSYVKNKTTIAGPIIRSYYGLIH